jgi:hypothetical protein
MTETNFILCKQCGIIVPYGIWYKRKIRNKPDWDHCTDCNAKPKTKEISIHPSLGRIECLPYTGELNDLWQPINAIGDLYLPGERICGKSDCVNKAHIRKIEKPVVDSMDLLLGLIEAQDANKKVSW